MNSLSPRNGEGAYETRATRSVRDSAGFITIEIVVALSITALVVGGVLLLLFEDQRFLENTEVRDRAYAKARAALHTAHALSRLDFHLVNPVATTTSDAIESSLTVTSGPDDPYGTKTVIATTQWRDALRRTRTVVLTSLVTNHIDPASERTCNSFRSSDWTHPTIATASLDASGVLPGVTAGSEIGDIDIDRTTLFVALNGTSSPSQRYSILAFDTGLPGEMQFSGGLDNAPSTAEGVAALRAAYGYIFMANAHQANWSCAESSKCAQLQVVSRALSGPVSNAKVPGVTGSSGGVGNAIEIRNHMAYLGLTKPSGGGTEFNIFDVTNPLTPLWRGGYRIGRGVNAITIQETTAYVGTDDPAAEVVVLDVSDAANPRFIRSYDLPGSGVVGGNGRRLQIVGSTLYVARDFKSTGDEFYALSATSAAMSVVTHAEMASSINGLVVRDGVVFAATKAGVMTLLSATTSEQLTTVKLPASAVALDCELDTLYVASSNGTASYVSRITGAL